MATLFAPLQQDSEESSSEESEEESSSEETSSDEDDDEDAPIKAKPQVKPQAKQANKQKGKKGSDQPLESKDSSLLDLDSCKDVVSLETLMAVISSSFLPSFFLLQGKFLSLEIQCPWGLMTF